MSDIRLHTFRRSRNRNTDAHLDSSTSSAQQQQQPQPQRQHESSYDTTNTTTLASGSGSGSPIPMRAPLQAAAAAVATSSRRKKGRRRDEYGDGDSDEEATLLCESERDPGFEHNEEESRTARGERAHDANSQVRAEVAIPSSPLYNLMRLAPSAIDVSEGIKGQISYCSLTTARCVGISMRL
jgi:hypothetical protein